MLLFFSEEQCQSDSQCQSNNFFKTLYNCFNPNVLLIYYLYILSYNSLFLFFRIIHIDTNTLQAYSAKIKAQEGEGSPGQFL